MFHVLAEGDVLLGDGNSVTGKPSPVLCRQEPKREAIGLNRFKQLVSNNKLNKERCCKGCYAAAMRKVGRSLQRASEEATPSAEVSE